MNSKIRNSLLVAGLVGLSNLLFAQTVEQGRKFFYYQRYKSALDAFDKTLASNPNNIDAVYWKGQTLIQQKDSSAAEALYRKSLESNGNAPLLLVGMGHIELKQGKTADAHGRFETAISLTKSKDVNILNAVGWANVEAKGGDAAYAIEKLNLATQTKNFNNPETYLILGDAYRKMIDGGSAVQSYQKALTLDSKNAAAKYKIGMIYLTQNNKDYFLPAFEEATQLDPAYTPAYYQLFYYWYFRDVNKAAEYLDKYIANADSGPEVEYLKTDFLYASSKFTEAKAKAQALIASLGDKVNPRMYKMVAYACDTLADLSCAQSYLDQYFAKQKPEDFLPRDYSFRAHLLSKTSGSDSLINLNFQMALAKDTVQNEKIDIIKEASDLFKKKGNKVASAYWQGQLYNTLKTPTNTDLYNLGIAYYQAGSYKTADSVFCGIYESKYPTEIYGYLWCARSKQAQDDSTNSQGLAVDAYDKLAQVGRGLDSTAKAAGSADSVKYKSQILSSYFFLAQYHNDVKKDKQTAIGYLEKVLEVDPTNATALKFLEILKRPPAKQPAARPKPAAGAGASKK